MKKILLLTFLIITIVIFGCSIDKKDAMQDNHDHNMDKEKVVSSLIREGEIDVSSIDENNDNNLFQCPMDWNVLSDAAGECPVCGMNLKKFELDEVKKNLTKYGYNFKK